MLGKRPRTTLRTSFVFSTGAYSQFPPMKTFSRLRDHNCSHDAPFKPNSVASTALRQVIGFNPIGNVFSNLDSDTTLRGAAQPGGSARGPKSPRSALQDLLAAAREGDPNNVVKPSSWSLPEKENDVISEASQQAGGGADRDHLQSLDSKRIAETQVATGPGQAPQLLHRTKAIGFAAVLVESCDNPKSLFGSARILDTRDHRLQRASASKGCRRKQYGGNSLFLCLAASPSTSDHSTDPALSMDFLNSCYLCRRPLTEGKDVFMYNGDKAFCSEECRYRQIAMDERKEKCPPASDTIRFGFRSGSSCRISSGSLQETHCSCSLKC